MAEIGRSCAHSGSTPPTARLVTHVSTRTRRINTTSCTDAHRPRNVSSSGRMDTRRPGQRAARRTLVVIQGSWTKPPPRRATDQRTSWCRLRSDLTTAVRLWVPIVAHAMSMSMSPWHVTLVPAHATHTHKSQNACAGEITRMLDAGCWLTTVHTTRHLRW